MFKVRVLGSKSHRVGDLRSKLLTVLENLFPREMSTLKWGGEGV